jgi:AAA domain
MKDRPDINDTLRDKGEEAVRERLANAKPYIIKSETLEAKRRAKNPKAVDLTKLVLTEAEWEARELAPPDYLLGNWFTTTTRALLTAPTGTGKSMIAIPMGRSMSAAKPFLRWAGRRQARILYVDGEMSSRLLKTRLIDEKARSGFAAPTFYALSIQDIPNFEPLSTPTGQTQMNAVIEHIGGIDGAIFDNNMSLIGGDMKDGEPWRKTLPFVLSLTARNIGQLWLHHTGHDESRSYGDKTKEWMMDTTMFFEDASTSDVSAKLVFRKARERTPQTRADFEPLDFSLTDGVWVYTAGSATKKHQLTPLQMKFLEAFHNVPAVTWDKKRCISIKAWKIECRTLGLIDDDKPDNGRARFSQNRIALITANYIGCNGDHAWMVE